MLKHTNTYSKADLTDKQLLCGYILLEDDIRKDTRLVTVDCWRPWGTFKRHLSTYWQSTNLPTAVVTVPQVVDGWDIDGQVFPSDADHPLSLDERYRGFCGHDKPRYVMIMSQNVALLQYRIPHQLQQFRVRISYHYNPARTYVGCSVPYRTSSNVHGLS